MRRASRRRWKKYLGLQPQREKSTGSSDEKFQWIFTVKIPGFSSKNEQPNPGRPVTPGNRAKTNTQNQGSHWPGKIVQIQQKTNTLIQGSQEPGKSAGSRENERALIDFLANLDRLDHNFELNDEFTIYMHCMHELKFICTNNYNFNSIK